MDPVEVNIGDCTCAHSNGAVPHLDGDLVYLRPRANLEMGVATQEALRRSGRYIGDSHAVLYSVLIRHGVTGWNLVDIKGASLPFTVEALLERLETPLQAAMTVKAKAHELYYDAVLDPLQPAKSVPPRPSLKTGSTSPSRASGRRTPTSPAQSSPSAAEGGN